MMAVKKNKNFIMMLLAILAIFFSKLCNGYEILEDGKSLEIEFSQPIKGENNKWKIISTIKNTGSSTVFINNIWLPWASRWSINLGGITVSVLPKMLQPAIYIDHPRREDIYLLSGEIITGEININRFFIDFTNEVEKHSIGICYMYAVRTIIENSNKKIEGCYLIPRS